jgi:F-type H+-transporting ATPase subunit beta
LRDEFKDYPESALYMIGAIDEARGKAKAGRPVAKGEPESKTEAKGGPRPAADSKPKAKSEPPPKPDSRPRPEVQHAAADTHES